MFSPLSTKQVKTPSSSYVGFLNCTIAFSAVVKFDDMEFSRKMVLLKPSYSVKLIPSGYSVFASLHETVALGKVSDSQAMAVKFIAFSLPKVTSWENSLRRVVIVGPTALMHHNHDTIDTTDTTNTMTPQTPQIP